MKELRMKLKDMDLQKVASAIRLSPNVLYSFVSGRMKPRPETIAKIKRYLKKNKG